MKGALCAVIRVSGYDAVDITPKRENFSVLGWGCRGQTLILPAIPDHRDILGHAVAADKRDTRISRDLLARLSI